MDEIRDILKVFYYKIEGTFYTVADKYFFQIMEMMICISILVLAVAVLYPLLEKWFGAKWRKMLWIFLAVRLLIPLHYSLPNAPVKLFQVSIYQYTKELIVFFCIWLLGIVVYLCWQFFAYVIFRMKCIRSMEQISSGEMFALLSQVKEELNIKKKIGMYCCESLRAPMVLGFRNQILLIPKAEYTHADFKYILSHECIHIAKRDIWLKLLLTFITGLYWFNPFVHWMKNQAFHDIEIVCDSHVVHGKSEEEKVQYSKAILEVLNRKRTKNIAYSTDFYSGKNAVKERISNILGPEKRNGAIQWGILFLVLLCYAGGSMLISCGYTYEQNKTQEEEAKKEADLYKDYKEPPVFNEEALSLLDKLKPVNGYFYVGEDKYEDKYTAGKDEVQENPYRIVVRDPDFYANAAEELLYTYFDKYINEAAKLNITKDNPHPFSYIERVTTLERVAGDREEFAAYINFSLFYPYTFDDINVADMNWGIVSEEYVDCSFIVIARQIEDYVYELEGIVQAKEGLKLLYEKVEKEQDTEMEEILESYDMLPRVDISFQEKNQARISDEKLQITYDSGVSWQEVPVSLELLFDRGDGNAQYTGGLERGSYQVSEEMTIFAFGGSEKTDTTVIYSKDKGNTWEKSVVTDFLGSRKLSISMVDKDTGYIAATGERVMGSELVEIYKTVDGATTWTYAGIVDENGNSLMMGMSFANEKIGFVTCKSGQFPYVYRTTDGGASWKTIDFNPAYASYKWYREGYADAQNRLNYDGTPRNRYEELRSYYTMAFAPKFEGNKGVMYVAMEEYGELGNNQLKLVSEDAGMSWSIEGIVYRQEYRK